LARRRWNSSSVAACLDLTLKYGAISDKNLAAAALVQINA